MKLLNQVALLEHPDGCSAGVLISQVEVDEREAVQIERFRGWYRVGGQFKGVVIVSSRMVTQTLQGNLLLRHQFAS